MVSISCFRSGVPGQSKPEASSKAKTELPGESSVLERKKETTDTKLSPPRRKRSAVGSF